MNTPVIEASGLTLSGPETEKSEDFFSADDRSSIFVVADSVGRSSVQKMASRITVELINKSFRKWIDSEAPLNTIFGHATPSLSMPGNYVLSSIRLADGVIRELAAKHGKYVDTKIMLAVLAVVPGLVVSCTVGKSRVYLIREGEITALCDNTGPVLEEDSAPGMKSGDKVRPKTTYFSQKDVGASEIEELIFYEIEPVNGDRFILYSEELSNLISDYELLNIVMQEIHPAALCRSVIEKVRKRGGQQTSTVVSVFLSGIKTEKK